MGRKEEKGEGVGEEGGKNDNFLTQSLLNIGIPLCILYYYEDTSMNYLCLL